jgi:pimeloyl-ACP methyl ester carboxylesterase
MRLLWLTAFIPVAIAVAALILKTYLSDLSKARARISGSEVRTTPCGVIELKAVGEGPALLISHGAGGGFDQGLELAATHSARGFRVIGVSRFGYLRSPVPDDASPERQADTYACVLDALGVERASVVGASAGAPSALQFALRYPERTERLVLLVPALFAPKPRGAPVLDVPAGVPVVAGSVLSSDLLYWLAYKTMPQLLVGTILATPPGRFAEASSEERARVDTVLRYILPVSARRLGLANDAAVISHLGRFDLERVRTPTLLVSVEDDRYGTFAAARYTAENIPGARFLGYAAGGHLRIGHHAEVTHALDAFLRGRRDGE